MTTASFIAKSNRHKCHRIDSKALTTHYNLPLEPFGWRFVLGWKSFVFSAVALVAGQCGENRRKLPSR